MRIGLIPNPDKDPGLKITIQVASEIVQLGGVAVLDLKYKDSSTTCTELFEFGDYDSCSMLMCLGGDGTFLAGVHEHFLHDIPMIGVNLGRVGFLAEIKPKNTMQAITRIFKGEYQIEKRMLLESTCYSHLGVKKIQALSLNDLVVNRGSISRILNLDLFIDGILIEKLPGDGVIISTPTGSTAYSLSAGGPIVEPKLEAIIITPLNPHTLHNRSYVVAPDSQVEIIVKEYPFNPLLTSDGAQVCTLDQLDRILVTKSKKTMNLVKLDHANFYESLTTKIYDRGI